MKNKIKNENKYNKIFHYYTTTYDSATIISGKL